MKDAPRAATIVATSRCEFLKVKKEHYDAVLVGGGFLVYELKGRGDNTHDVHMLSSVCNTHFTIPTEKSP